MQVTEDGFHRESAIEMSLEGWTEVCQANTESLDSLHEYSYIYLISRQIQPLRSS